MMLWEKIFYTVTIIDICVAFVSIIIGFMCHSSIENKVMNVVYVSMLIFILEFIFIVLYSSFKIILWNIWGINLQWFSYF